MNKEDKRDVLSVTALEGLMFGEPVPALDLDNH